MLCLSQGQKRGMGRGGEKIGRIKKSWMRRGKGGEGGEGEKGGASFINECQESGFSNLASVSMPDQRVVPELLLPT